MRDHHFHLAEFNISRLRAPLDSPMMKEFVDFLDPVNRFAEQSPGFIWRLTAADGLAASYLPAPFEDEMMITNLTVWQDIESLGNFTYQTVHTYFLRSRKKWFDRVTSHQVVMWWILTGDVPTLEEAKQKLQFLEDHGPSADTFTFQAAFDSKGHPWKSQDEIG